MPLKQSHTIKRIYVRTYTDTGQEIAGVEWSNGACTQGALHNPHMLALFARGEREGLTIERETW